MTKTQRKILDMVQQHGRYVATGTREVKVAQDLAWAGLIRCSPWPARGKTPQVVCSAVTQEPTP